MAVTGAIQVGTVELDDNLHLMGFETNPPINYSVRYTLGGNKIVQTHPRTSGAELRLIARHDGSSRMGQFCSSHLDSLRALAETGNTYALTHPAVTALGRTVNVKITMFNVEQSDEREPPGPNKKWHGEILLEEI